MKHLRQDFKIIRLLESLYQNIRSAIRTSASGELSNWFEMLVGVLQCVLSLLLFNVMLEVVMALYEDDDDELGIAISGFTYGSGVATGRMGGSGPPTSVQTP